MKIKNDPISENRHGIDKLKDTYLHWTRTQLKKLHSHLHLLERQGLNKPGNLMNEIFDLAHNIKGLGGSFGYFLMTDIAASLCDYVRNVENIADMKIEIIFAHVTAMDVVISKEIEGSGGETGNEIIVRLQEIIEEHNSN